MSLSGLIIAAMASISTVPVSSGADLSAVDSAIEMAIAEEEEGDDQVMPSFASELEDDDDEGAQIRLRMMRVKLKVPI